MSNQQKKQKLQYSDLDDTESPRSCSDSSKESSRSIRRKEEFVYIPYSYQIEQGLTGCFRAQDQTPVMLRSEKAQTIMRKGQQKQEGGRLRRFTSIIYGYSALFFFLAIHCYMTWRDDNYHNGRDETKDGVMSVQMVEEPPASQPWNHPNNPLFGIEPPSAKGDLSQRRTMEVTSREKLPHSVHYSYQTKRQPREYRQTSKPTPQKSFFSSLFAGSDTNLRKEQVQSGGDKNPKETKNSVDDVYLSLKLEAKGNPEPDDNAENRSSFAGLHRPPNSLPFPAQSSPLFFDAFDEHGNRGYIADPTALRRWRSEYLNNKVERPKVVQEISEFDDFWATLKGLGNEARYGTRTAHIPVSALSICAPGPGRGKEDEGGYKLFSEKIQIAPTTEEEQEAEDDENDADQNLISHASKDKLLCAVYSHAGMYSLARTAALTWGYKCDGFLVFGDSPSIPELGFVQLEHKGPEAFGNMWQKVRSIWAYLHHNYLYDYQYFHMGGDDMYVIPENLKWRLSQKSRESPNAPIYIGQQVPLAVGSDHHHYLQQNIHPELPQVRSYVTGGPGYTLNRKGLQMLIKEALPACHATTVAPYEDRLLGYCLNRAGLSPTDSRDPTTGEQTYHGVAPHTLYTRSSSKSFQGKASQYWQQEEYPTHPRQLVGPKNGLDMAARYSVSFHNLFHPIFMARVHTLLYPQLCPPHQEQQQQEIDLDVDKDGHQVSQDGREDLEQAEFE